jgi:hypothetical protein
MLSMPSSVKVLVSKYNIQDYRGAQIKHTIVTTIECINNNNKYLNPIII